MVFDDQNTIEHLPEPASETGAIEKMANDMEQQLKLKRIITTGYPRRASREFHNGALHSGFVEVLRETSLLIWVIHV